MDMKELTEMYAGTVNEEKRNTKGYKIFVCLRDTKMEARVGKRK
jgi:hypothetical protein